MVNAGEMRNASVLKWDFQPEKINISLIHILTKIQVAHTTVNLHKLQIRQDFYYITVHLTNSEILVITLYLEPFTAPTTIFALHMTILRLKNLLPRHNEHKVNTQVTMTSPRLYI